MHLSYRVAATLSALALALPLVVFSAPPPGAAEGATAPTGELGELDFRTSAEGVAQRHFLRGVGALHSFWYDEAADAFRAAQEADPGFALAYWGEAMTHNHPIWNEIDREAGRAVLEALGASPAERAARAPSERERAYLAAVEILFFGDGAKADRDRAYERAMAELVARWPDDPEATAFHSLALLGLVYGEADLGAERTRTLIRAAAPLEELFDAHPRHPGVLHYLIHSYDDPTHAPLGLRPARVYAEVAPAAHHALHMPSHIFVQLGRWDEVAASNEDAWAASVAWVERRGLDPAKRDFHSLGWLHYAYLQQGRVAAAEEILERVRRADDEAPSARVQHARAMIEARHLLATGKRPERSLATAMPFWLYAEGVDALRSATLATAVMRLEELNREAASSGHHREEAEIMALELEGQIEIAEGRVEEGLATLRRAAEEESALPPPMGPPVPLEPAWEVYGKALLDAGRAAEAREAFDTALRRTPRRTEALLGAARAARALGADGTARRYYRELAEIWHAADKEHAGRGEVRSFLEAS